MGWLEICCLENGMAAPGRRVLLLFSSKSHPPCCSLPTSKLVPDQRLSINLRPNQSFSNFNPHPPGAEHFQQTAVGVLIQEDLRSPLPPGICKFHLEGIRGNIFTCRTCVSRCSTESPTGRQAAILSRLRRISARRDRPRSTVG